MTTDAPWITHTGEGMPVDALGKDALGNDVEWRYVDSTGTLRTYSTAACFVPWNSDKIEYRVLSPLGKPGEEAKRCQKCGGNPDSFSCSGPPGCPIWPRASPAGEETSIKARADDGKPHGGWLDHKPYLGEDTKQAIRHAFADPRAEGVAEATATPRTDAVVRPYIGQDGVSVEECDALLNIARQLERELATMREAEHAISDAYVRLREIIGAMTPPRYADIRELWTYVEGGARQLAALRSPIEGEPEMPNADLFVGLNAIRGITISRVEAYRDSWRALLAARDAEIERLKAAYKIAYEAADQSHTGHWDSTGGSGSGCPECIRAREARKQCNAIVKATT